MKYVFSHMTGILIACLIGISLLTSFIYEIHSQLSSASDGIEILMVDTSLSLGNADKLADSIKDFTHEKYVGISTLSSAEAENYIRTVENYPMYEYLKYLTSSRDCELIIFPQSMLETVMEMNNKVPLDETEGDTAYVFPLRDKVVTDYGANVICTDGEPLAVLINGDRIEKVREYLLSLKENDDV